MTFTGNMCKKHYVITEELINKLTESRMIWWDRHKKVMKVGLTHTEQIFSQHDILEWLTAAQSVNTTISLVTHQH